MRRNSGDIVEITHPKLKAITDAQFKQIQRDTKAAKGHDVLSYRIEYKTQNVMTNSKEIYQAACEIDSTVDDMSKMGE